jgi:signal transduction histidine kinase
MKNDIKKILINIFEGNHTFTKDELFLEYKIKTVNFILVSLIFVISGMTIFRYYEQHYLQSIVDFVFATVIIVSYIILRKDKYKYKIITRVVMSFAIFTDAILFVTMHSAEARLVWLVAIIIVIFFLLDKKEGRIWSYSIITVLTCVYAYDGAILGLSVSDFATLFATLVFSVTILHWYETIKEVNEKEYIENQKILENKIKEEVEKNRQQEQMLAQQSKMVAMGEMIGNIAHQWRQPLSAISSQASSVLVQHQLGILEDKEIQSSQEDIIKKSEYLSETINDFRDFIKGDKKKADFLLDDAIEKAIKITEATIKKAEIKVTTNLAKNIKLNNYQNELLQSLVNIINNAKDALIENDIKHKYIKITIECEGEEILLSIKDNGGGIPKDIIETIFDPYFTTKDEKNGTGLGLYMSKIIIEKHEGGNISVVNDEDGAVFKIRLKKD